MVSGALTPGAGQLFLIDEGRPPSVAHGLVSEQFQLLESSPLKC